MRINVSQTCTMGVAHRFPLNSPPKMDNLDTIRWRSDLQLLLQEVQGRRPTLFSTVADDAFIAAATRLNKRLPELAAATATAEMTRLISMINLRPMAVGRPSVSDHHASRRLPIKVYDFADGIFITDGVGPCRRAIGHRLVSISGTPIDQVVAAIDPLTARDDMRSANRTLPLHLISTSLLYGLGIIDDQRTADLVVAAPSGTSQNLRIHSMAPAFHNHWTRRRLCGLPQDTNQTYLSDPWKSFWFAPDTPAGVFYIQANRATADGGYRQHLPRLAAALASRPVQAIVIDFRMNLGEDANAWHHLADLAASRPGCPVFTVAAGKLQHTAAGAIATAANGTCLLETGGTLADLTQQTRPITLPNTGISVHMSGLFWRNTSAKTSRTRRFPLKSLDFFNHRDPAIALVQSLAGSRSLTPVI